MAWARRLFDLCCLSAIHPEVSSILEDILSGCSLETCAFLMDTGTDILSLQDDYDRVKLILISESGVLPFFRKRFFADDRLLCFLAGSCAPDRVIEKFVSLSDGGSSLQELYFDSGRIPFIKSALGKPGTIIQLPAREGRGRRLLLCHTCLELALTCFMADSARLHELDPEHRRNAVRRIRQEVLLRTAMGSVAPALRMKRNGLWTIFCGHVWSPFGTRTTRYAYAQAPKSSS